VIGTDKGPEIDCEVDLRGRLDTAGLFGVIGVSAAVISMDSAVLHIAAAMRKPTVGIFGGVDYRFRVRQEQPVVAMQAKMACCPCNKRETCEGTYDCIRAMRPEDVLEAVGIAEHTDELIDYYAAEGIRR
jgi:heptosyltransferase-2